MHGKDMHLRVELGCGNMFHLDPKKVTRYELPRIIFGELSNF